MKHYEKIPHRETAEYQARHAGRKKGPRYYGAVAASIFSGLTLAGDALANPSQAPSTHETPTYEHQPKIVISEATPAEAVRTVEIKKGGFLVNGKQASLNLIYGPAFNADQADMMVNKLGVNLIADNVLGTTPQELSAKSNGRYWIMPGSRPKMDPNSSVAEQATLPSNAIGVTWEDEPDGHQHNPAYESSTLKFKGLPNLQTFNQQMAWHNMYGNDSYDLNGQHLTHEDYLQYIKNLDTGIVMMDFYPLVEMTQPNWKSALDLTYQTVRGVNNTVRAVNPNNLTGYWLALSNWHAGGKPLTPEVIMCESIVAQAAGANALGYWADSSTLDQILPETFNKVHKMNKLREKYPAVFNAPTDPAYASAWHDDIKLGVRHFTNPDGSIGQAYFVANDSDSTVSRLQQLPGSGNQVLTNILDGTKIKAHNSRIELHKNSCEGGIYLANYEPAYSIKSAAATHAPKHTKSTTLARPQKK